MCRKSLFPILFFFTALLPLALHAQEGAVTLTQEEYQSILQRLAALEQKAAAAESRPEATPRVDAVSGATALSADSAAKYAPAAQPRKERPSWVHNRLTIGGYGEATARYNMYSHNYLRYFNPEKYKGDHYGEVDLPHVVISLGYDFGRGWSMGTEIEFEHGGTESAFEKEEEEGGEYESEVERGGEVALEQFWIQKTFNPYASIRAGMQIIPVGGLNAHHEPTEFFTVYRPEGEFTILPSTWHEVALTFWGQAKGWRYQLMLVPGLDSDRFNKKNWIKPGAGSPYEFKLANCWAGVARVDYTGVKGLRLSVSGYCGNSFRNTLSRGYTELEKTKFKEVQGIVSLGSFDFCYNDHNWVARGSVTYGHLSDSKQITAYNLSMTKSSPSSREPVASDALAAGAEVGYDFFNFNERLREKRMRFYVFGRYDFYDSRLLVDGAKDWMYSYCGRHKATVGINYFPIKEVAVKAEFGYAILNKGVLDDGTIGKIYNDEPAVSIGIVYAGFFRL